MRKFLKFIGLFLGIGIGIIIIIVLATYLIAQPIIPKDAVAIDNEITEKLSNRQTILEFIGLKEFPNFESVSYEWTNEEGERTIIVQANFVPELSEEENTNTVKCILADSKNKKLWTDHDGFTTFDYNFTTSKDLPVPQGLNSKSKVAIQWYYGDNMFYITYTNPDK